MVQAALKRRGRESIDGRDKLILHLTVVVQTAKRSKSVAPKVVLQNLVEKIQWEDSVTKLERKENEGKKVQELSDEEFIEEFALNTHMTYETFSFWIIISTSKSLNQLKHNNGGRLLEWLIREGIRVTINKWRKERYATIGFIAKRHATITCKEDLEEETKQALKEVESNEDKKYPGTCCIP